jgi:hypothetical protein
MFSDSFQNAKPPTRLDVGQVLGLALAAIGRNWLAFTALTIILVVLPTMVNLYLLPIKVGRGEMNSMLLSLLFSLVQTFTVSAFFKSAVSWTIWAQENRQRPSLLTSLGATSSVLIWIVGVSFVCTLGMLLGFLLLVVPGVIVAMALWVAVPACVVERLGVAASIRRSLELTRGQRWRLLLMYVAIVLVSYIPSVVIGIGTLLVGDALSAAQSSTTIWNLTLRTALSALMFAAAEGCAYVELRRLKEGAGAANLAQVFA